MKKIFRIKTAVLIFIPLILLTLIPLASAHCPLCTTGAAIGVGFTRAYGVDDSIVGVFLGALVVSSALWFNKWLKKKVDFPLQELLIIIISFLSLAIPFYQFGIITNFEMTKSMPEYHGMTGFGIFGLSQFGADKLLFGMIIGTLSIWGVFAFSDYIKKKRGAVLWQYQGLSFMAITLALLSLVFWSLTR